MRLCEPPVWDESWGGVELGRDATHRWLLLDYGFNLRLVTIRLGDPSGYEHGWCYRRDVQVVLDALKGYDPETQDEPPGWHKRPAMGAVRRAPHRERDVHFNRPRCEHGAYEDEECPYMAPFPASLRAGSCRAYAM